MSDQKQMWQLVKFELASPSLKHFLNQLLVLVVTAFIFEAFIYLIHQNSNEHFSDIVFDVFLLLVVLFYPQVLRQPAFRITDLKGGLYATPFYVYATQLPIKQHVLMRSRFILSFVYCVSVTVMAIAFAYVFPKIINALFAVEALGFFLGTLHDLFTPAEFGAFITIWGLFAAAFSGLFAAADVGGTYTKKALFGYNILYLLVLLVVLAGLNFLTGRGLVDWTIVLATNAPFSGIVGFALFALVCHVIWHWEARRYARKVDYHV